MLEKHEAMIRHVTTRYQHTYMVFIEALNKLLMEQFFKVQDEQELRNPEKVSWTWVKHLYRVIGQLNDMEMSLSG